MSEAHEDLERAEHAAHGGGQGHSGNKLIGLTMALIGVLIAFCAAMVGSERNELTRTMIEQTQAHSDYTGASTKFRLVMMELEKERLSPAISAGSEPGTPETQLAHSVLERFIRLYTDYSKERSFTKAWSDSFKPAIEAHFEAAEGYERAQLIAEIGIVVASLAVLLSNRPAWYVSIVLAVLCVLQLGLVFMHTRGTVRAASDQVEHAEEAYQDLRKAHVGANEDEKTVETLDPGGKIRAAIAGGEEHVALPAAGKKTSSAGEHEPKKE
ncbi:MAG TPA: DUF4337 family protein [Chthoniobacter sp.]|jgi:hypothetical protein